MNAATADTGPLGVFGGTFDPIHVGHLRLAEEARDLLGLAHVRFVPAGDPPHRRAPRSRPEERLEMVRRATAGNPAFSVDEAEVLARGKSYTVLTLERLRAAAGPARALVLILGADAFRGLTSWHRWRDLLGLAHIAVATRPGYDAHAALPPELAAASRDHTSTDPRSVHESPAGRIVPFDMTPLAISASRVRALIHSGRSARYLLPDAVLDYVVQQHLYHGN